MKLLELKNGSFFIKFKFDDNFDTALEMALGGHLETIMDIMRMDAPTFISLKDALIGNGFVKIKKMHMSVEELLGIFFYIYAHRTTAIG